MTPIRPVAFVREVEVELRKLVGTRGPWLLLGVIGVLAALVTLIGLGTRQSMTFDDLIAAYGMATRIFVGILAILLVTSEWGQRTLLSTFTLEPRRERIIAAKLTAALLGALAVFAATVLLSAVVTLLRGASFSAVGSVLQYGVIAAVFDVLMAFAIALAVLNTAGAIVSYIALPEIVVPLVLSIASLLADGPASQGGWVSSLMSWVYPKRVLSAFQVVSPGASAWAHLLVCAVIWIGIPAMIGVARVLNSDVK